MSSSLNLVVIRVTNLDNARSFYETLGLRFSVEQHGSGPQHLAAELGDVVFEIYPLGKGSATTSVRLGFRVSSIANTVAAVEQLGGQILSPPTTSPWGMRAVLSDPDGHKIELSQPDDAVV